MQPGKPLPACLQRACPAAGHATLIQNRRLSYNQRQLPTVLLLTMAAAVLLMVTAAVPQTVAAAVLLMVASAVLLTMEAAVPPTSPASLLAMLPAALAQRLALRPCFHMHQRPSAGLQRCSACGRVTSWQRQRQAR
jgi:hypothetical protein